MIEVSRLKPEDLFKIEKNRITKHFDQTSVEDAVTVCKLPDSYAVYSEAGRLLAIGGIIPRWAGRGEAWMLCAPKVREYLEEIAEVARGVLSASEINRIEMAVDCSFEKGHEWALRLGFVKEADVLEAYDSLGNDCTLYARIKNPKKAGA